MPQVLTVQASEEYKQRSRMRIKFVRRLSDLLTVSIRPPQGASLDGVQIELEYSLNIAHAHDYTIPC